jgi:hypothetical protein
MPDLKVVSERSAAEMRQQEATRALKATMTSLTGNLIRIVRGVGKEELVLEQVRNFAHAYTAFVDAHGHEAPAGLFNELLQFEQPELPENDELADTILSEYAICRSALQVVASSLLDQERQQGNALSQLRLRLQMWEDERRARRKKRGHPAPRKRSINPKPKK